MQDAKSSVARDLLCSGAFFRHQAYARFGVQIIAYSYIIEEPADKSDKQAMKEGHAAVWQSTVHQNNL
jgi:hypothetical protein